MSLIILAKDDFYRLIASYKERTFDEEHRFFKNKFLSKSNIFIVSWLGTENLMSCLHVDDYKGLVGIDF